MLKEIGRQRGGASYARDDVVPPMGLLYLGAALKKENLPVKILDDSLSDEAQVKAAMDQADYVGISSLTPNVPRAIELIKMAKQKNKTVILGGAHATSDPGYFLKYGADYVVIGEGERSLPELIKALDNGENIDSIQGIGYPKENGELCLTQPRPLLEELDSLAPPAWDLIDPERYFDAMGFRVYMILGSRGCPNNCVFCNKLMSPRQFRKRDPIQVVDELEEQVARFEAERVYFLDDLFTCDTKWVKAICHEIIGRGLKVVWECESRVTNVDLNLFMLMRKAGCIKIHFGVESGSEAVLKRLNKKITVDQVLHAAKCARLAGIWYKFFLIFGFPWETLEDLKATREMIFKAMPDNLAISLLIPMPGTAIWDQLKAEGKLYPDAEKFDGLHYFHRKPSYDHDNLSHEELDRFRSAMLKDYATFYRSIKKDLFRAKEKALHALLHPGYIFKRLGFL